MLDLGLSLKLTGIAVRQGGGLLPAIEVIAGLGFDLLNFPIAPTVTLPSDWQTTTALTPASGSAGITPEAVFDARSNARSAPATTYYVGPSGADANSGLTTGAKKLTLGGCITAGNATGLPYKIVPDSVEFVRNVGFNGVQPTQDVAIVPASGRMVTGIFDAFGAMTLDATYGNCYTLTIGSVDRLCNRLVQNAYGDNVEYTYYPTAAALSAATLTTDGFAYESGKVYMRRLDGAVPTPTNTRLYRGAVGNLKVTAEINVYLENIDLEGGQIGAFEYIRSVASTNLRVVVGKNCSFKYGGGNVNQNGRSVSIDGIKGLAYFFGCTANAAKTDGFNFHDTIGNGTMFLTVNCVGNDNGRASSISTPSSCNGLTGHETLPGVDIAGVYLGNHGGSVRNANAAKTLCAGTMSQDDGDLATGIAACFQTDNTSQLWCDRTKAIGAADKTAYLTSAGTSIHKRNVAATPGQSGGSGTIDLY